MCCVGLYRSCIGHSGHFVLQQMNHVFAVAVPKLYNELDTDSL